GTCSPRRGRVVLGGTSPWRKLKGTRELGGVAARGSARAGGRSPCGRGGGGAPTRGGGGGSSTPALRTPGGGGRRDRGPGDRGAEDRGAEHGTDGSIQARRAATARGRAAHCTVAPEVACDPVVACQGGWHSRLRGGVGARVALRQAAARSGIPRLPDPTHRTGDRGGRGGGAGGGGGGPRARPARAAAAGFVSKHTRPPPPPTFP